MDLRDGWYWVIWDGDVCVAKREDGEWRLAAENWYLYDEDVRVLGGPLEPPPVPGAV